MLPLPEGWHHLFIRILEKGHFEKNTGQILCMSEFLCIFAAYLYIMNTNIILSYLLIVVGVMCWIALLPGHKKVGTRTMNAITVFGGAFLFASCFINLVPHMYLNGFEIYPTGGWGFKVGAAVLLGFIIQLLLERLTKGIEHGHNHTECHDCEIHDEHHLHPVAGLLAGLSIHAFMEGMPLIGSDGDIHQGLLYGIVLHNIPIVLVMLGLFMHNRYSFAKYGRYNQNNP